MDENTIRAAAHEHVQAIVERRLDDALIHVMEEGRDEIGANLAEMCRVVTAASVEDVQMSRDQGVAYLRFNTPGLAEKEMLIESHWGEEDGRPRLAWAFPVTKKG